VVAAVEARWTGTLTTTKSNWTFNMTQAQKDAVINTLTRINVGTIVLTSGC
jgi:hypothetical protein